MSSAVRLTNFPGLDLDGTLIRYGLNNSQELRFNHDIWRLLPRQPCKVAIITDQGGLIFHDKDYPDRYPSIKTFVRRLEFVIATLAEHMYWVADIRVSLYWNGANPAKLDALAQKLRTALPNQEGRHRVIYTCPSARKPETLMLRASHITAYYGDSASDQMAALRIGIPFIHVPKNV